MSTVKKADWGKDIHHGQRVSTKTHPWSVKGIVGEKVYYHVAFRTKKAAQGAARGIRSLRDYGTQKTKPNTVSVLRRSKKRRK